MSLANFSAWRRESFRVETLDLLRFVEGTKTYSNINIIRTKGSIANLESGYSDVSAVRHDSVFMIQKKRGDKSTLFPYYIELISSEQFRIYQKKSESLHAYEMIKIRIEFSEIRGHDNSGRVLKLVIGKLNEGVERDYTEDWDDDYDEIKERNEIHIRFQFQHNIFYFLNYLNAYRQATEEKSILIPGPSSKTFYDRVTQKRLRERFKRVMKKKKGFLIPVVRVLRNIFQVNASHNINDHTLDGRFNTFEMKHAGLPFYSKDSRVWTLKDFHTWLDHIIVVDEKKKKPAVKLNLPPKKNKGRKKEEEDEEEVVIEAKKKKESASEKKINKKKNNKKKGKRGGGGGGANATEGKGKSKVDPWVIVDEFVLETISTAKKVLEDRGLLKHLSEYFNESKQRNVFMVRLRRDIERHFNPPTPCTPNTPVGPPQNNMMSSPTIGEKHFEELFEEAEDVMKRIQFHAFILTEFWDQNYNINFFRVLKRVVLNFQRKHLMKKRRTTTPNEDDDEFDPKVLYDLESSVLLKYRYLWDYRELQQNLMVHMLYNRSLENLISSVESEFNGILAKSGSAKKMENRRKEIEENFLKNPEIVLTPQMKREFGMICGIPEFWDPQEFDICFKNLHAKYNKSSSSSSSSSSSATNASTSSPKKKKKKMWQDTGDVNDDKGDDDISSSDQVIKLEKVIVRESSIGTTISLENISFIIRNLRLCSQMYHSLINQQDSLLQIFEDRVKNLTIMENTRLKIEKVKNAISSKNKSGDLQKKKKKMMKEEEEEEKKVNNDRVFQILENLVTKEKKRGKELDFKFDKLRQLFLTQKSRVEEYIWNMNILTNHKFFVSSSSEEDILKKNKNEFIISNDIEATEWRDKEFEYYRNNFHEKSKCLEVMIRNELKRIEGNGTHILEIKYKMILSKKCVSKKNNKIVVPEEPKQQQKRSIIRTRLPDIFDSNVDFEWNEDPYVCYFVFRNIVFYFLENSLIIIDDLKNPKYPIHGITKQQQQQDTTTTTTTSGFCEILVLDSDCPLVASVNYIGRIMEKFSDHLILYNSEVEYSNISKFMTPQEDQQLENSILSSSNARKMRKRQQQGGEDSEKNEKRIIDDHKKGGFSSSSSSVGGKTAAHSPPITVGKGKKISGGGSCTSGGSMIDDDEPYLNNVSLTSPTIEDSPWNEVNLDEIEEDDDICVMALLEHTIQKKLLEKHGPNSHHHEESLIPKIHMNTQEFVTELLTILSSSPGYPIVQRYLQNVKRFYEGNNNRLLLRRLIVNHNHNNNNNNNHVEQYYAMCDNYSKKEEEKERRKNSYFTIDPLRYIEVTGEFFRVYHKAVTEAKLKFKRYGPSSLLQHELKSKSSEDKEEKQIHHPQQPQPQPRKRSVGLNVSSVAIVEDIDDEIENFRGLTASPRGGGGGGGTGFSILDDSSPLTKDVADEHIDEEIKKMTEVNAIMKSFTEETKKDVVKLRNKMINQQQQQEEEEEEVIEIEEEEEEEKKKENENIQQQHQQLHQLKKRKSRKKLGHFKRRREKKSDKKSSGQSSSTTTTTTTSQNEKKDSNSNMVCLYRLFFRTHQEIDLFTMECCQINPLFAKDFQGLWHLLKSYDRAFTMRYELLRKKEEQNYQLMKKRAEEESSKGSKKKKIKRRSANRKKKNRSFSRGRGGGGDKKEDKFLSPDDTHIMEVVKADFRGCPFRQMEIMSIIRSGGIEDDDDDDDDIDSDYVKKEEEVEGEGED